MRKKVFLAVGVVILAIVAIGVINLYPRLSMKPSETGQIPNTEIYSVNNKINSIYFIKADDGYILVDAGSNVETVEKTMAEVNIDPSEVKYILLTHSDSDHVASLELFDNATIYMSEDELQMINGTIKRNARKSNSLPLGIDQDMIVLVNDGQELTLNEKKIQCIKVPGHTPGSMAYLLDGEYLFSGDAFRVNNNLVDVHPFSMDTETSENSIQELTEIINESKMVLTAHYGHYDSANLIIKD